MTDTGENAVHPAGRWPGREKALQRIVYVVLGLLLLVTAFLKVQGPLDGALDQNTILFSPRLQFAVMEVEALLGLLLLSGWAKRAAWFFAVAFFVVVAGASLYLGLMGQSSCGCFGVEFSASPWYMFVVDLIVIGSLVWLRPPPEAISIKRSYSLYLRKLGFVLLFMIPLVVLPVTFHRPIIDFLFRVEGYRAIIDAPVKTVNVSEAGNTVTAVFSVRNISDQVVTIYAAKTGCGCASVTDLPLVIPAGERRDLGFEVRTKPEETRHRFAQEARLFLDAPSPPVILRMSNRSVDFYTFVHYFNRKGG